MKTIARKYPVVVERATLDEWPAIHSMRRRTFEEQGIPYIAAPDAVRWVVARIAGNIAGALGYVETGNELWGTDLLRVDGHAGTAAVFALGNYFNDMAARGEFRRRFAVAIENQKMQTALYRHGFIPRAIIFGDPG